MLQTQTQGTLESKSSIKVGNRRSRSILSLLDNFNNNMKVIENQFRKGEISYLENKTDIEEDKSKSPTSRNQDKPKHVRKTSVLTKDILKNYTRSMVFLQINNFKGSKSPCATGRTNDASRKTYSEFTDEVEIHSPIEYNKHIEHIARYKSKRRIIGDSIAQSSTVFKSTTSVTHQNPSCKFCCSLLIASEIDNTTRKVESLMNNELNSIPHEIRST